ncbi:MAG: DUF72 domain-containing protein [Acidobacteria bacterium]|nr:DUF72 domain-containing protein [Acidobacteriota bacterium]
MSSSPQGLSPDTGGAASRVLVGTSGYNYAEWRGNFYPEKLPAKKMLPFYAERLSTVEINYTFYRMPTERLVAGWSEVTPDTFRLTLKAPRRITHLARLRGCEDTVSAFCDVAQTLGPKLGVLLFQLPPSFKKDLAVLDEFLGTLPPRARAAFEFRHASWHDAEVFDRLRARRLALCVADSERVTTPVEVAAPYGYFRLRDQGYQPDDIARWAQTITTACADCDEVFVYFKHEDEGKGPEFARLLLEALPGASR